MDKILEVKKLKIAFRTSSGTLKAVRDISFDLERGKTLAIVGESGSGKSVTSKAIIGILAGNSITEGGEILYDGRDLLRIPEDEMHRIRGDKISMIFQDPLSSLNPIVKIGKQITEAMLLKNKTSRAEARKDFSKVLNTLTAQMTAATNDPARVKQMVSTFRKACSRGSAQELRYNQAMTLALDRAADMENRLDAINKKPMVRMPGALMKETERLTRMQNDAVLKNEAELQELKKNLTNMSEKERPDFFALGYCQMRSFEPKGETVAEINASAQERLDQEFMGDFLKLLAQGIEHSSQVALEYKRQVITELEKAHAYYMGDFTRKDALAYAKQLNALVAKSIDRTEIIKDSAAYTFGSSLTNAINEFFSRQKHNAKEEKRFARQTAKVDAMIARGKKVEWKVIPKNVYTIEDLRNNILTVVDRLHQRYTEQVDAQVDYMARAQQAVDYMKEKQSVSVYKISKNMAKEKAIKLMEEVGIHEPRVRYYQYPFEFSGGMRQRIVIAIALAADPDILICDEPTTALDVTIQAQILELINKLKRERNLSVIFITHDLGVVANMADDIAVMYAGKIIEYGTADDIFYDPRHPYTWALLSSMPDLDTTEKLDAIPGTPPNMIYPPVGDAFADRNKYAMAIDFEQQPPMFRVSDTHSAATWLLHPDAPKVEMPRIITERIARMTKAGGEQNG